MRGGAAAPTQREPRGAAGDARWRPKNMGVPSFTIRQRQFKISDNIRYSPPPRDPGRLRRRQRKNAVSVLQSSFSNDLCAHVADFRASWLGSILRFSDFEILNFEIFGLSFTQCGGSPIKPSH